MQIKKKSVKLDYFILEKLQFFQVDFYIEEKFRYKNTRAFGQETVYNLHFHVKTEINLFILSFIFQDYCMFRYLLQFKGRVTFIDVFNVS